MGRWGDQAWCSALQGRCVSTPPHPPDTKPSLAIAIGTVRSAKSSVTVTQRVQLAESRGGYQGPLVGNFWDRDQPRNPAPGALRSVVRGDPGSWFEPVNDSGVLGSAGQADPAGAGRAEGARAVC